MKLKKTIITTALSAGLVLGVSSPVFAAEQNTDPGYSVSVPTIKKTLDLKGQGQTITIKPTTFNFTVDPVQGNQFDFISDKQIQFKNENKEQSLETALLTSQEANRFLELVPGEYAYSIMEMNTADDPQDYIKEDTKTYTLKVIVKNKNAIDPEAGKFVEYAILDTHKTKTDKAAFTNEYKPMTSLDVKKIVKGSYGNKDEDFQFKVTFNFPYEFDSEYDQDAVPSMRETMDFTLRHNGQKNFTNLPAGTKVILEEMARPGYTQEAVLDGAKFTMGQSGESPLTFVMGQENVHTLQVTNTKEGSTPTGIMMNNLPYILLTILGTVGIGFYLVSKRRMN